MSGVDLEVEEGSVTSSSTRKPVDCIPSSREQAEEGSGTCNVESASPLPKSKGSVKEIVFGKMKREEDITAAGIGDVPTGSAYKAVVKARAEAIGSKDSMPPPMIPNRKHTLMETPETIIGPEVHMKGELSFRRLLRIDGSFTGKLSSTGNLIIGENGTLIGDLDKMGGVIIEGKIIGNINVEYLELKTNAVIHGDITCKSLAMGWGVKVVGKLNVHPDAPGELHPYPFPLYTKQEESYSTSKEFSKSSRGLESRKSSGGQISAGKVKENEIQEPKANKKPKNPGMEGRDNGEERNILEKEKKHSSKEKRKNKKESSKVVIQTSDEVTKRDQLSLKNLQSVQQEKEGYLTSSLMPDDIVKQENEVVMASMTHNEAEKLDTQAPEVAG